MSPPFGSWPVAAALFAVVSLSFVVEASIGFGATVITVALGAMLAPVETLLPAYVPVNLLLSLSIAARSSRHVDVRLLTTRVLPLMLLGMPVGMLLATRADERLLRLLFGAFVLSLSLGELFRSAEPARAVSPWSGRGLLALGGVVHGAFATGGPLVVYVLGRELGGDKARFRATLSVLWATLGGVLLGGYAWSGKLGAASLTGSSLLAGALVVGMGVGEVLHRRVRPESFRRYVFTLLAVASTITLARAALVG